MKKGLIATTLAGTVLATGVLTGQAHAAEQKQPIYVFTEKQFNEHRTGETEGFGGGPGSDVGVVEYRLALFHLINCYIVPLLLLDFLISHQEYECDF